MVPERKTKLLLVNVYFSMSVFRCIYVCMCVYVCVCVSLCMYVLVFECVVHVCFNV